MSIGSSWTRYLGLLVLASVLLVPRPARAISVDYEAIRQAEEALRQAWTAYTTAWNAAYQDALLSGASPQDARAAATSATASLYAAAQQAATRLANLAPWLMRGGFITLSGTLYVVLAAEIVVAGYLTYLLIDATIDYYDAQAIGAALDEQIAQVQARIDAIQVEGQGACCCYDRRNPDQSDSAAWTGEFYGESSCRALGSSYYPIHCYDGRPRAAQIEAAGGVAQACAATHTRVVEAGTAAVSLDLDGAVDRME